jgi:hypothetical protein
MARRYFGGVNAVGKAFILGGSPAEIVGVVKDAYTVTLNSIDPLVYQPVSGRDMPTLMLRSLPGDVERIQAVAKRLDPRIQVHAEPLTAQLERHLFPARTASAQAGTLGLLALGLAEVGMFGVFAYIVRQRTREIGIRIALGAKPNHIVRIVIAASSQAVISGFAAGLLLSFAASRFIARFLYGINGTDLPTYGAVSVLLLSAAAAASSLPARRALHIDPVKALHYE